MLHSYGGGLLSVLTRVWCLRRCTGITFGVKGCRFKIVCRCTCRRMLLQLVALDWVIKFMVTGMAGIVPPLHVGLVLLLRLWGCGLLGGVRAATIEQVGKLVKGPLWNQTSISLFNESLSGSIPPELGSLTNLTYLDLGGNSLWGTIPSELGKLAELAVLDLSGNKLSGPIPLELGSLTNLLFLDLGGNSLSGPIPPELGKLVKLLGLDLSGNSLSGPIPPELGSLAQLTRFDVSNNKLSGSVPPELGSLTELNYLSLAGNNLSGPIPPELGNLFFWLQFLFLNNNNFSGPIPPELGNLNFLTGLFLNSNHLSGPILSELGSLTQVLRIDLSNNNLLGSVPPKFGNLYNLQSLDIHSNNVAGLIPPELSKVPYLRTLRLESTNVRCDFAGKPFKSLTFLGLPCSAAPWVRQLMNLTLLQVEFRNSSTQVLDLSSVPSSCKVVNLTGPNPALQSIKFWEACSAGCVVDLRSSEAKLSRSTRREICLGRISVFLDGDAIEQLTDPITNIFNNSIKIGQRIYNLTDPNFVDIINLGPNGRSYTGVGFSRVPAGNLCGNPEAKLVIAVVFGVFAVALLVATISIIVVARWRWRIWGSGSRSREERRYSSLKDGGLYLWGAAQGVLPVVDLVTDFLVLSEVWGRWPMWVILTSVCAPFVVGAFWVSSSWASPETLALKWKGLWLKWLWPLPEPRNQQRIVHKRSLGSVLLATVLLPLALLCVLVQDLLSVTGRFGLHVGWEDEIVVFELYHEARVLIELLLETLPQAVFQTALYLMGTSRATRIYIDQRIFMQSIVVLLCSLAVQYCCMLWEAIYEGESLLRVFLNRFRSAGKPVLLRIKDNGLQVEARLAVIADRAGEAVLQSLEQEVRTSIR